jgi:hypothetical protein
MNNYTKQNEKVKDTRSVHKLARLYDLSPKKSFNILNFVSGNNFKHERDVSISLPKIVSSRCESKTPLQSNSSERELSLKPKLKSKNTERLKLRSFLTTNES